MAKEDKKQAPKQEKNSNPEQAKFPGQKPSKEGEEPKKEGFRYLIRIANTDLDGNKSLGNQLTKIKGINYMLANAVCRIAGLDVNAQVGYIKKPDETKLNDIVTNPKKYNIPGWMFNRRRDPETAEDKHLLTADLDFTKANDIKFKRRIKSYEGMRHSAGLPVRGQRTKANFRKSKSKGKGGLGVKRKPGAKSGRT